MKQSFFFIIGCLSLLPSQIFFTFHPSFSRELPTFTIFIFLLPTSSLIHNHQAYFFLTLTPLSKNVLSPLLCALRDFLSGNEAADAKRRHLLGFKKHQVKTTPNTWVICFIELSFSYLQLLVISSYFALIITYFYCKQLVIELKNGRLSRGIMCLEQF